MTVGRLAGLEALAAAHVIEAPAVLPIGQVAAVASTLGWGGNKTPYELSNSPIQAAFA